MELVTQLVKWGEAAAKAQPRFLALALLWDLQAHMEHTLPALLFLSQTQILLLEQQSMHIPGSAQANSLRCKNKILDYQNRYLFLFLFILLNLHFSKFLEKSNMTASLYAICKWTNIWGWMLRNYLLTLQVFIYWFAINKYLFVNLFIVNIYWFASKKFGCYYSRDNPEGVLLSPSG